MRDLPADIFVSLIAICTLPLIAYLSIYLFRGPHLSDESRKSLHTKIKVITVVILFGPGLAEAIIGDKFLMGVFGLAYALLYVVPIFLVSSVLGLVSGLLCWLILLAFGNKSSRYIAQRVACLIGVTLFVPYSSFMFAFSAGCMMYGWP